MSKYFLRVYDQIDFDDAKKHTLEYGVLSGACSSCKEINLKLEMTSCPKCGAFFKYIAFQNVKEHLPKMLRILSERQGVQFLDYQDFKRVEGEVRARNILG